ncbi:fimbria/pilus outer membrane usher protein [Tahibacter amnicola]|uniref:Fimbria/pilus outer membrane usher protein n=1 Tax=Tahibacter amnicola TaxID=2976241 RepID=A0ABY6BB76_9GAMM|nr:fimbria/pilus outer membrane usher protein [Tahibacter amnicola]UXI67311.1 fimbria/pilus outer membrane usher protein [Tahibacter amnicola]
MYGRVALSAVCRALFLALLALMPALATSADEESWLGAIVNGEDRHYTLRMVRDRDAQWLLRALDLNVLGLPVPSDAPRRIDGESFHRASSVADVRIEVRPEFGVVLITAATPLESEGASDWLLTVNLNHVAREEPVVATGPANDLVMDAKDLHAVGLRASVIAEGPVSLRAVPGLRYSIDVPNQVLSLYADTALLQTTVVRPTGGEKVAVSADLIGGAALNYELVAQHADTESDIGGLFEAVVFRGTWSAASRHALLPGSGELVRLETGFVRDYPETGRQLRIGDAIGGSGTLGVPVRFGGIHYGTERSVQPWALHSVPIVVKGESALPGVLDVFINSRLVGTQPINPGPFDIGAIPGVTGSGNVRAVVRDVLGRVQVIESDFYGDPGLLMPGKQEWSIDAGKLRVGFGGAGDRYGDTFAAASWRRGMNPHLTLEGRMEWFPDHLVLGAGLVAVILDDALVNLGVEQDMPADGPNRHAVSTGVEHRGRHVSAGARLRVAQTGFTSLSNRSAFAARRSLVAYLNAELKPVNLGISRIDRETLDGKRYAAWNVRGSVPLWLGYLQALVSREDETKDTTVSLSYVLPLGPQSNLSANASSSDESSFWDVSYQKAPPRGTGAGYRASVGAQGGRLRSQASVIHNGPWGVAQVDAARVEKETALRGSFRGGVVWADGRLWMSRWLDGPFAVVDGGAENVEVTLNEQVVGRADESGRGLAVGLLPYQRNVVGIDDQDVPLEVSLQRTRAEVVPARRSGVRVHFAGTLRRSFVATIVRSDGAPVPAGSDILANDVSGIVGANGLAAFEAGMAGRQDLIVSWPDGSCSVGVDIPQASDGRPGELGTITCL